MSPAAPAVALPDVPPAPEERMRTPPAPPLWEAPVAACPFCAVRDMLFPAAPEALEMDAKAVFWIETLLLKAENVMPFALRPKSCPEAVQ
jgi:hypothetical protein